ncbi:hypothetical protein GCM10022402_34150 [Salinactinospora qingdaonensis]|uniref:Histidine kinase/HSP90-like ATPase domain-containing protein n=2 Tax=Salinactinospora qingdaonensis TaxID=702744 RepID=A0ABP7G2N9_9ACTN
MSEGRRPSLPKRATCLADRVSVATPVSGGNQLGYAATFRAEPAQAVAVRRHVRAVVGLPRSDSDTVELLAQELFGNALAHSRSGDGGEVTVTVTKLAGWVQVAVTDGGPRADRFTTPHLRPVDPDSESGRGLLLVHSQADRWGVVFLDDGRTTTWFEIDRDRQRMRRR